ncbi:GAF domain-containing protein [Desulfotomaculum arcticum]|uniref:histidine kinase n=1 Tax=Desulfotruncus arcticus DSM 17038 TaxID=1121424 RepID=A0A1I2QB85_9FIRM|nr:GAF domain-containing sensor histidine kinase [Desulfotruncus arcticus]SFG25568.1 GAF domain-containing protein [Desulfotomaculum arcticum] [Desulfotruncus arcticus DSM 17038]
MSGKSAGLSPGELSTLLEISRVITSSLPLRNMFETIHAYLSDILTYEIGSLYINEKSRFNLKAGVGVEDMALTNLSNRAGTNYLLKKIKGTGRPWRSSQVFKLEQIKKHPFYVQVLEPMSILYTAGAPIRNGHQILGSIHLGRKPEDGDFSDKDMQILEMVANLLSPAIRNIKIKKISWQLDGLAVSGSDRKAKNNSTAPSNGAGGDRQMQLLGSVSSVMAKELRNPLSGLKMSFYSLARNFTSGVMAQQDLEQMDCSIKKMEKTIRFLLCLSGDIHLQREWVDINDLMDEVVRTLGPIMDPDVVIIKDYSSLPNVYVDREKMHTVFGNVIENALDAMPGGGRLRIITTENQGRVYVILEDNGMGVDAKIKENIFDPFISNKSSGVGLGLTICERIVGSHGGKIKLRSNGGKGTAVCIDMPVDAS